MLRALFISSVSAYWSVALTFALIQLFRGQQPFISWLGLVLAAGAPVAFLAWLYLAGQARTARHPVFVSLVCGLGTAMTMAANWRFGISSGSVHLWAGACLLGWISYLRWYSVFPGRNGKSLVPGRQLPEFSLTSMQGEVVSSASFRGSNYVLLFYRGNWCPLCSAQIAELATRYHEIQNLGTEVVLISSQPQNHSLRLARKFDVAMHFYQDINNAAARELGVIAPSGTPMGLQMLGYSSDTAMPTVIITDAEGEIIFVDQTDNYRVRPEPELFLEVLRKIRI